MFMNKSINNSARSESFTKSAITLCLIMIFGKVVGAFYRLPLTNILGPLGIGFYQMVFPLYSLILTISSSAIPHALSKLISERRAQNKTMEVGQIFFCAAIWLVLIGFAFATLVCLFSKQIAQIQGNGDIYFCYYAISPAIIFAGLISVYRGYFQGYRRFIPSGVSALIEQLIKMIAGLILASIFIKRGALWGVFGALVGISISELVSLFYLVIIYLTEKEKTSFNASCLNFKYSSRCIGKICLPLTIGGLILPLIQFIDSGLVVRLLECAGFGASTSTSLFGISTGAVGSLINLPVVLSLSLSSAVLPNVAALGIKNNNKVLKQTITKSIILCFMLVLPCAVGFIVLKKPIITLLYGKSFNGEQIILASNLLQIGAFSVIFLAFLQVFSGILHGFGKYYLPTLALVAGGLIKLIVSVVLIKNPYINIFGDQISNIICFFVASFICFLFIKKYLNKNVFIDLFGIIASAATMAAFITILMPLFNNYIIGLILCIILGGFVYAATLTIFYNFAGKKHCFFS